MASQIDTLSIGGITFDAFSTPDLIPGGGKQMLTVHKLPGGARVIDTLGRDDSDITWRGTFFSNDAMNKAIALDSLRMQGSQLTLTYVGRSLPVVIESFLWSVRRYPMWVEYAITCVVVQQGPSSSAASSSSGVDTATSTDAATASDIATGSTSGMTVGAPTETPVPFTGGSNPFGGG
jgi:hypothetical protein